MQILDVKIDNLSKKEVLEKIVFFLNDDSFHQIATINPEFILQARKDLEFRKVLNNCDLCVADGIGIWFAFLRFGKYLKNRFAGIDLMQEILEIANKEDRSIFLIANNSGLSNWRETRKAILKKYPNLKIKGVDLAKKSTAQTHLNIDSEIVFCALGAPEQERFLHSLKSQKNGRIRLTMGIGGGFDFLTGKIKRAPGFMRRFGLEWFWRFLREPKYRAVRILKAIIVFPIRILINK
jgi:N-acetylglucosaminyldiphosphoundecaprenol N-acetyl-beta-D-mannosaminyltransferase